MNLRKSSLFADFEKWCFIHIDRLITTIISAKVSSPFLSYQDYTAQYNVTNMVYYEIFNNIQLAAAREKRLKEWKRQWKIDLIEKMNPDWQDLYHNIIH